MQEQGRKDMGIEFIPTIARKRLNDQLHPDTKRVPSVVWVRIGLYTSQTKRQTLSDEPSSPSSTWTPSSSWWDSPSWTHGTSAIGKTISGLIIGKNGTKLKCAIVFVSSTRQLGAVASSRTSSNSSKTTNSDNHSESIFFSSFLYRSC